MKILQYRTTAAIYPHLSLEAVVKLQDGRIVFSNISINNNGKKEVYCKDNHWTYRVPMSEINPEEAEDYYAYLPECEEKILGEKLVELWNKNPTFKDSLMWTDYGM